MALLLQEVKTLKNQATGDVSVEVNSCPGPDLKKILEEMRCQYETMIDNNRREVEQWYENKVGYACCPQAGIAEQKL